MLNWIAKKSLPLTPLLFVYQTGSLAQIHATGWDEDQHFYTLTQTEPCIESTTEPQSFHISESQKDAQKSVFYSLWLLLVRLHNLTQ